MTLVSGLFISQRGTYMYLRRSTQWEEGGLEETIGLGWDKHEQSHCVFSDSDSLKTLPRTFEESSENKEGPIKYYVGRSVVWIWTWMKTKNSVSLELKRKWLTSKELDYISSNTRSYL